MSLVCNIVMRGTLPGVMVGVLTSDVSIFPLYNCPMMVTCAELVHIIRIEVVDVSRGGVGGKV